MRNTGIVSLKSQRPAARTRPDLAAAHDAPPAGHDQRDGLFGHLFRAVVRDVAQRDARFVQRLQVHVVVAHAVADHQPGSSVQVVDQRAVIGTMFTTTTSASRVASMTSSIGRELQLVAVELQLRAASLSAFPLQVGLNVIGDNDFR